MLIVYFSIQPVVLAQENLDPNYYEKLQQEQKELKEKQEKEEAEMLKQLELQRRSEELTAKAKKLVGTRQGQCVIAVRSFLNIGRDEVQGYAKNTRVNSKEWQPGAIIVFRKMSYAGHVGVALYEENGYLYYYDSNGDFTQRGAIRKISLDSSKISGYRIIKKYQPL